MFPCSGCFIDKGQLSDVTIKPQYRSQEKMMQLVEYVGPHKNRSKEHSIYPVKVCSLVLSISFGELPNV